MRAGGIAEKRERIKQELDHPKIASSEVIHYLNLVARYDRPEAPALPRLITEAQRLNYDHLLETADSHIEILSQQSRRTLLISTADVFSEVTGVARAKAPPVVPKMTSIPVFVEITQTLVTEITCAQATSQGRTIAATLLQMTNPK